VKVNQATHEEHSRNLITNGAPVTIEEWIDFHESVDTLPEEEKMVFEMFFYGGFTDVEIAGFLGCSDRTVRRHWMKSRITLQQRINTDRETRQKSHKQL
jgi:DNA-directed RNA polymerase specialized sigma24 family protein